MARVFITGSADGLGRMAAQLLVEQGHNAVLHARRGREAMTTVPGAETVVIGDLSSVAQMKDDCRECCLDHFEDKTQTAKLRLVCFPKLVFLVM
jgi:NAD(P)-dependent dehydrogenase (short-subunit alcohol dehydrogenase family)